MNNLEIDLFAAENGKGKALNKPFRTPKGPKKFSVYVKNDKGNIVKVNFGDPNMEIKRDDPARRKSYRARHHCEDPGPKWKANYWSCKMWSAKPVSKITGSEDQTPEEELMDLKEDLSEMIIGSINAIKTQSENILNNLSNPSVLENLSEPFLQQMAALAEDYVSTIHNYVIFSQEPSDEMEQAEAGKQRGLWDNIRDKKKRMNKNYRPSKPGDESYPDKKSYEKAQGQEWDGKTFAEESDILKENPLLAFISEQVTEEDCSCGTEKPSIYVETSANRSKTFNIDLGKLNK